MIERLFVGNVCSSIERIDAHIQKHRLNVSRERYLEIAEEVSGGIEGVHEGLVRTGSNTVIPYTVVLTGSIEQNGMNFLIVRSVRKDGLQQEVTCLIHGNFPYSHGFCPFCELQLNTCSRI
jgi:hypothetical protein